MTDEQKHLQEVAWNCVSALKAWQGCFEPDSDIYKMQDTCIKTFEKMITEWECAIGHPSRIHKETIIELVDRVGPIMASVIRGQIARGEL